jgi:hypothetical protein
MFNLLLSLVAVIVTDGEEGACVDPGEKGATLEVVGPGLPGGGKGWQLEEQGTGSPHLQETAMHRVSAIVHCVAVTQYNYNRKRVYCIICFRKINHLVPITICIHPLMYRKLC